MTKDYEVEQIYLGAVDDCIERLNLTDPGCCTRVLERFRVSSKIEFLYEHLEEPLRSKAISEHKKALEQGNDSVDELVV